MDISFAVDDLRASAAALDRFLSERHPGTSYLIGDHYDTSFDRNPPR